MYNNNPIQWASRNLEPSERRKTTTVELISQNRPSKGFRKQWKRQSKKKKRKGKLSKVIWTNQLQKFVKKLPLFRNKLLSLSNRTKH